MRCHPRGVFALCLIATVALGGCGDDVNLVAPPKPVPVRAVVVSPGTASIRNGETLVMVAEVSADSGVDRSVTWSSADPRRATISANGIVTAVSEGISVITATSKLRPEVSGSATITVLPAATVRSIVVTPGALTVRVGQSVPLVASVVADSGADRSILWTSVDPSRVSISSTGVVTALAEGTAVVTATSKARSDVSTSVAITVIPAAGVKSLSVTPPSLEVTVGQQQALVVTIQTDEGVSRAVTFESSSPTVATVSPTGVVTAVGPGTATVTVTPTADARMAARVIVLVRPPAPPLVSIQSITQGGTGLPVNLSSASGQIDVAINVEAGQDPLATVDLVVSQGGRDTVVASQSFQAAFAAVASSQGGNGARAVRTTSANAVALAAPSSIVLSFRTEMFVVATGAVAFHNGAAVVRAVARSVSSGGGAGPTASNSVAITLANRDGFYVAMRALSSTGITTATDAAGLAWTQAGLGLVVTTVPVMYSGHSVSVRAISFPGSSPAGSVVSTKAGIATDTLLLPGYDSPSSGPMYVAGEIPSISAVDESGSQLVLVGVSGTSGAGVVNASAGVVAGTPLPSLRIDNEPPPSGATMVLSTATSNSNNWINGAYAFATGLGGIVADAGVGLPGSNASPTAASVQATFHVSGGALADTAVAQTGADLAATNTHLAYSVLARYADRLGNARSVPLSASAPHPLVTFGVDLQAPTIRYVTTPPAGQVAISNSTDSVYTATNVSGASYVYGMEVNDDRSGFGSTPIYLTLSRLSQPNPPGTTSGTTTCVLGTIVAGACTPALGALAGLLIDGFRQATIGMDNGAGVEGYYTYAGYVRDQAGNASTTIRKTVLFDAGTGASAPQLATIGFPAILRGGQPAAFAPIAADNVELVRGSLYVAYPVLPTTPIIAYEGGSAGFFSIGTLFDAELTSPISGAPGFTVPLFIRAMEITDAAHSPQPYATGTVKPSALNAVVRDGPNLTPATLAANILIAPAMVENPSGAPGYAALTGMNALAKWRPYPGGTSPLRFEAVGPSGQTVSPFTRVILVRLTAGVAPNTQVWRVLSELTTATGSDNGLERVWRYDFGSQSSGSYIAIGVNATGDAIASQVVAF